MLLPGSSHCHDPVVIAHYLPAGKVQPARASVVRDLRSRTGVVSHREPEHAAEKAIPILVGERNSEVGLADPARAGDGRDARHGRIRPQEVIEAFQLITPPNKQRIGRIGHSEGWGRRTRIGCEDGDGFGALDVGTAAVLTLCCVPNVWVIGPVAWWM